MYHKFSAHLDLTKSYWKNHLTGKDIAIDATCGNGHDTLFLAQMPIRAVIGIDIQPKAIENTKELLQQHGLTDRVFLHCASHEDFKWLQIPLAPKLIIYNLGYLPKGDKNFTTQTETTLTSFESALAILGDTGAISVTCYPGHKEGAREEKAIVSWAQSLEPKEWFVCYHQWLNRKLSPTVFWIQKIEKSKNST